MPARILIADDYEDNRELLRLILVTANYEVFEARDGEECVNLAQIHLPDLIMLDLSMPKLDGWETFRALKDYAGTSRIPCIAVTAYAEFDRRKALEAGFSEYLAKPFRTGDLLAMVADLTSTNALRVRAVSEEL
jgi:CheY-like chemotaxis protein